ncbi:MAG: ABC transporter ATP-binding protein, partial [Fibrobacterota bacterium]
VGSLMARITSDVDVLNQLFSSGVVNILGEIFMLIFIVGFMLFLDVKLTLITFITLPFIAWGTILFKTRVRDSFRSIRLLSAKINTIMQETVSGIDVVQLFRGQNFNRKKFAKENGAYRDEYIRTVLYYGLYFPFVKIMNFTAMALIIYYGGIRFLAPGHGITVGELVAFITYAELFFQPIRELCDKYNILQSSMAASERIFGLLDTDEYIPEPESAVALNRPASTVSFSNVTFGYVPGVPVINNFSLSIRKGEKVAVVGTSGAGKTTLINLLNRFYEPWSGSIKLGGIDISRLSKKDIRRAVGTVSQDIVLFSGTVGDNISLFDETVSPEKKAKVASSVNAAGFAGIRGEGTDTILGEGGSSISVGQRQLLSFARLLVYDPDIVVLDEATSSVDTESELKIQKAISKILKGRTSIIVAHRLSTVRNADRIIVLHKGAIAEEGSHDELLRRGGIYHRLYTTQFKAEKK